MSVTASASVLDWDVLREEGVTQALSRAARKVVARHESAELADLLQEGAIWLATRHEEVRGYLDEGRQDWLVQALFRALGDKVKTETRRGNVSLDAMLEGRQGDEDGADQELADGEAPPPRQRVRNGEYGGKMMGLRWAAPYGSAGGPVTVRRVAA